MIFLHISGLSMTNVNNCSHLKQWKNLRFDIGHAHIAFELKLY